MYLSLTGILGLGLGAAGGAKVRRCVVAGGVSVMLQVWIKRGCVAGRHAKLIHIVAELDGLLVHSRRRYHQDNWPLGVG